MRARVSWSSAPAPSSRRRRPGTDRPDSRLPRPLHLRQAIEVGARDRAFGEVVRISRGDEPQAGAGLRRLAAQDVPLRDLEMRLQVLLRPAGGDLDHFVWRAFAEVQLNERVGPGLALEL